MKYHLFKATRMYGGEPYRGPSSNNLFAQSNSLDEAKFLAKELQKKNPIGWDIFDSETKQQVFCHYEYLSDEEQTCELSEAADNILRINNQGN